MGLLVEIVQPKLVFESSDSVAIEKVILRRQQIRAATRPSPPARYPHPGARITQTWFRALYSCLRGRASTGLVPAPSSTDDRFQPRIRGRLYPPHPGWREASFSRPHPALGARHLLSAAGAVEKRGRGRGRRAGDRDQGLSQPSPVPRRRAVPHLGAVDRPNEGLGRLRKQASRREDSLEEKIDEQSGDYTPAILTSWREIPAEALERKELGALLRRAIEGLPGIYRNVVLLRDIEEMDVRETAAALGITEGAVKVRLHRARALLQRELAPQLKGFAPQRKGLFGWGK